MNNYQMTYNVDLVFCIDSTGSMKNIINIVKQNALNLYQDICSAMEEKNRKLNIVRVRVIAFRDYIADKENAMTSSEFFNLPDDAQQLQECVNLIEASGGGDKEEDGLEALAYAIRSKWNTEGIKKRHVIVIWTDAATHPLGYGADIENYPKNMAKSFEELSLWWGDMQNTGYMDNRAKRLILYTPDEYPWDTIAKDWDNVIHAPVASAGGLQDVDYRAILTTISNTI